MADREPTESLEACIETVHRLEEEKHNLEEENDQLRKAAGTFGQLAERLNQSLQDERRIGAERRQNSRPAAAERRAPSC